MSEKKLRAVLLLLPFQLAGISACSDFRVGLGLVREPRAHVVTQGSSCRAHLSHEQGCEQWHGVEYRIQQPLQSFVMKACRRFIRHRFSLCMYSGFNLYGCYDMQQFSRLATWVDCLTALVLNWPTGLLTIRRIREVRLLILGSEASAIKGLKFKLNSGRRVTSTSLTHRIPRCWAPSFA